MAQFLGNYKGAFIPGTRTFKLESYLVFKSDKFIWKDLDNGRRIAKEIERGDSIPDGWSNEWSIPRGSKTDGASIPRLARLVVGSPFGKGRRKSSAIHDVLCRAKNLRPEIVHGLFNEMVRYESMDSTSGKLMGWAVVKFGPE